MAIQMLVSKLQDNLMLAEKQHMNHLNKEHKRFLSQNQAIKPTTLSIKNQLTSIQKLLTSKVFYKNTENAIIANSLFSQKHLHKIQTQYYKKELTDKKIQVVK